MGRHLVLTKQKIEEMKKAGRGQGEFADYQPWLKVDDFRRLAGAIECVIFIPAESITFFLILRWSIFLSSFGIKI